MAAADSPDRLFEAAASKALAAKLEYHNNRCMRCWHDKLQCCICSKLQSLSLAVDVRIMVLMHHKEFLGAGDDAKLLIAMLPPEQAGLFVYGRSDDWDSFAAEIALDPAHCLILWPGDGALTVDQYLGALPATSAWRPVPTPQPDGEEQVGAAGMGQIGSPAAGPPTMLRCKISSELDTLQALHEVYGWVPGEDNVRPSPVVRAQKDLMLSNMSRMWVSHADWVCQSVFGCKVTRRPDGRKVAERPAAGSLKLVPQPWPYDLPVGTQHMVLWCVGAPAAWRENEDAITAALTRELDARAGGGDFVWYENPKMSVEDDGLYHVQVFWKEPSTAAAATEAVEAAATAAAVVAAAPEAAPQPIPAAQEEEKAATSRPLLRVVVLDGVYAHARAMFRALRRRLPADHLPPHVALHPTTLSVYHRAAGKSYAEDSAESVRKGATGDADALRVCTVEAAALLLQVRRTASLSPEVRSRQVATLARRPPLTGVRAAAPYSPARHLRRRSLVSRRPRPMRWLPLWSQTTRRWQATSVSSARRLVARPSRTMAVKLWMPSDVARGGDWCSSRVSLSTPTRYDRIL